MLLHPLLRAGLAALCNRQSGVMGGPGQAVAGVWETHAVHPAASSCWSLALSSGASGLKQHLSKRHLAAPGSGAGLLLHLLYVGWKYPVGERIWDVKKMQGRGKEAQRIETMLYTGRVIQILFIIQSALLLYDELCVKIHKWCNLFHLMLL